MSSNMFACLGDSDDESPKAVVVPKKDDKAAPAAKKDDKSAKPAAAAPAAASKPKDSKPKAEKANNESKPKDASSSPRPKTTGNKAKETPASGAAPVETERVSKDDNRGGRPGRGQDRDHRHGAPRHGNTAGELPPPRKREFDRRSGTGRSGEQRKGGRGPHSLGNVEQEAQDAEKNLASAEVPVENVDAEGEEAEATPVEPPAPPALSFDEFMAKRSESRANAEIFGAVKERSVDADFSGLKVAGNEELLEVVGMIPVIKPTKAAKKGVQRSTVVKSVTDLGFKSAPAESFEHDDNENSRGGRGGRGGGRSDSRSGRGGREGRSSRPQSSGSAARLDIGDSLSFPSL